jgi:ADP-ribose pyrophosphatase
MMPGMSSEPVRHRIYEGRKIDLDVVETVMPDGRVVRREIVEHPGAVVILPLLENGRVVMIRNQRYAIGRELLELPAGTLERGEDPRECAFRELIEETGYEAATMEPLTQFWTMPGVCTERMHAFVARGLRHVGQRLEETEQITVELMPMERVVSLIGGGGIDDGKSIVTILHFRRFCAD